MQLPYEIWKLIVSYLPVGIARGLYSVNSALFDIAMDLRYHEARLWTGSPKALVRKDLRVFRLSHLSSRPKTLHIDLNSIAISLMNQERTHSFGRIIPLIVSAVTRGKFDHLGTVPDIVEFVLGALPRLTAVTRLYVSYDYTGGKRDDPLILRLIEDVWKILGDRLQFLQLQVAFENFQLLLSTSLHLPCLEKLNINAEGFNNFPENACESIISTMIHTNSSSLRDVSFRTNRPVDFRPIFQSLQSLPRLLAIHLSLPFGPFVSRPFPAYDMLYSCRHHLEFLSIEFRTHRREHVLPSIPLFSENWCSVDLPCLRELRIDPPMMVFGQEFVDYIHRFASSLISLAIKPNLRLRYSEAEQLCSIFHDFLSLRNLSICIRYFSPDMLALLARTVPRLQTLNLCYSRIIPPAPSDETLIDPELSRLFYRAMQRHVHVFREWQLLSLDYSPFSIHSQSARIEKALADHLPNVAWFCGEERSIYLSLAQKLSPTSFLSPATVSFAML